MLQDGEAGRSIEPFLGEEFFVQAWSYPVITGLIQNPDTNIENILGSLEDEGLAREVRAAIFEPFGKVTAAEALASIVQLNDAHLVRQEREIREQLKHGPAAESAELLLRRLMEITAEKTRIRAWKP